MGKGEHSSRFEAVYYTPIIMFIIKARPAPHDMSNRLSHTHHRGAREQVRCVRLVADALLAGLGASNLWQECISYMFANHLKESASVRSIHAYKLLCSHAETLVHMLQAGPASCWQRLAAAGSPEVQDEGLTIVYCRPSSEWAWAVREI